MTWRQAGRRATGGASAQQRGRLGPTFLSPEERAPQVRMRGRAKPHALAVDILPSFEKSQRSTATLAWGLPAYPPPHSDPRVRHGRTDARALAAHQQRMAASHGDGHSSQTQCRSRP
ncbi:hypothetical protein XFF6992_330015 [Xanthomonas citri pv. fuscans]|nr:hypothetical protein XFF6992_330015 [Xanthomonas citri pv. fuscans]SOO33365.1 hypothetical protein XFF6994_2840008 [Xanthomonas citri pv. fuscans]